MPDNKTLGKDITEEYEDAGEWRVHEDPKQSAAKKGFKVYVSPNSVDTFTSLQDARSAGFKGKPRDGRQEYVVERIIGRRYVEGKPEYLVKWKDYENYENTWEPKRNLVEGGDSVKQMAERFDAESGNRSSSKDPLPRNTKGEHIDMAGKAFNQSKVKLPEMPLLAAVELDTEDGKAAVLKVLEGLLEHEDGQFFQDPVPYKQFGFTDYRTIVTRPMDLGTVIKKLKGGKYRALPALNDDTRLIWSNCMLYNIENSPIWTAAHRLAEVHAEAMAEAFPAPDEPEPTKEELREAERVNDEARRQEHQRKVEAKKDPLSKETANNDSPSREAANNDSPSKETAKKDSPSKEAAKKDSPSKEAATKEPPSKGSPSLTQETEAAPTEAAPTKPATEPKPAVVSKATPDATSTALPARTVVALPQATPVAKPSPPRQQPMSAPVPVARKRTATQVFDNSTARAAPAAPTVSKAPRTGVRGPVGDLVKARCDFINQQRRLAADRGTNMGAVYCPVWVCWRFRDTRKLGEEPPPVQRGGVTWEQFQRMHQGRTVTQQAWIAYNNALAQTGRSAAAVSQTQVAASPAAGGVAVTPGSATAEPAAKRPRVTLSEPSGEKELEIARKVTLSEPTGEKEAADLARARKVTLMAPEEDKEGEAKLAQAKKVRLAVAGDGTQDSAEGEQEGDAEA